ncbi:MAG: alanine racemase [bacterium]
MTHPKYGRPVWAEVDLGALQQNLFAIRAFLGGKSEIMAVVKAEAYGHGPVEVAQQLQNDGVQLFGVASLDEAIVLRENGITGEILILGYTPAVLYEDLRHFRIQQSIISEEMLAAFMEKAAALGPIPVHAKIDTGMGRLGVRAEDAPAFLSSLFESFGENVKGVFTHFAVADRNAEDSRHQLRRFHQVIAPFAQRFHSLLRHAANSAGTVTLRDSWLDCVRPGLLLYGVSPIANTAPPFPLRPVLRVKARIVQVKSIRSGESVGYGHRFRAERDSRVAILPIGYGDGYPRALSERAHVRIRGKHAPIIGNMSMDFSIVDITDIPGVKPEDEVLILGDSITAWSLAEPINSIPYEILCGLGKRIPRVCLPAPAEDPAKSTTAAPARKT